MSTESGREGYWRESAAFICMGKEFEICKGMYGVDYYICLKQVVCDGRAHAGLQTAERAS